MDWKTQHNPPHHIIELKIAFGAIGMCVMTGDTSLGHRKIRIDGFKVLLVMDFMGSYKCFFRVICDYFHTFVFELGHSPVILVYRPRAVKFVH